MNITKNFNSEIMNIIKLHSYDFYVINRKQNVKCTCVKHETSQADPKCPYCFGTGRAVTFRPIHGASQETKIPPTFKSDNFIMSRNYFIDSKYKLNEDDLIVDGDEVYSVFALQNMLSFEGSLPYLKYNCVKKRFDYTDMLNNFKQALINSKK